MMMYDILCITVTTDIVQMWNVDCIYDTSWCWILSYLWTSYLWSDYATSDTQRYKGDIDVIICKLYIWYMIMCPSVYGMNRIQVLLMSGWDE